MATYLFEEKGGGTRNEAEVVMTEGWVYEEKLKEGTSRFAQHWDDLNCLFEGGKGIQLQGKNLKR